MNVLIAGAGYVGNALAIELARRGDAVWTLSRTARAIEGATAIAADLREPRSLDAIPDAIDSLVYCAGASERGERAYEDAYVRGLENTIAALEKKGAKTTRAVFTSSTAVYAQDDGSFVDESSPTEPSSFSGRVLLRAESITRALRGGIALRFAGIYGPSRTWLVRRVASGDAHIDPKVRYGNRIHQRDCAGAIAHLLSIQNPASIYVGVDDDPAPLGEVYSFVAELLGKDPPRHGDDASGRGGNKRCKNDRLKQSGYVLRVPSYREGYPAIVRDFLAAPAEDRSESS
jgi:nucleoside-diphosphate-sugar epimerase